jgi:hypothetical protein
MIIMIFAFNILFEIRGNTVFFYYYYCYYYFYYCFNLMMKKSIVFLNLSINQTIYNLKKN